MNLHSLVTAPNANKQLQIWAVNDSGIFTCWKQSTEPNADWTDWVNFASPPGKLSSIVSGTLSDGRPQLWALTDQGLFSCWPLVGTPGNDWGNWGKFPVPSQG